MQPPQVLAGVVILLAAVASTPDLAAQTGSAPPAPPTTIASLRTEYKVNPLGIDAGAPRLSWQLRSPRRNVRQAAYQVRVADTPEQLRAGRPLTWDSNRVAGEESTHLVYKGPPLQSRRRYYWQVRVWDDSGTPTAWSEPAWWEMGLLSATDWQARWIEPGVPETSSDSPPALFRKSFTLKGSVRSARAYVTSRGLYELRLNGARVGDEVFTPGWTSYNKRLQYQTYDVTKLLKSGGNAAGVTVGNGWYRGNIGFREQRNLYGERLALLLQIDVTYDNGARETIASDAGWKSSTGPILMSEIYHGERYDARLEKSGWSEPAYDDKDWSAVRQADYPFDTLLAAAGPPVRRVEEIRPVKILRTPAGETVVDFGQNIVGWVRIRANGPAGTRVSVRHAEVLDRDGNFYVANLRRARQQVEYTLRGGGGEEVYEPHFTFQGFRYAAVDGYPGELTLESLTGVVIHSDVASAAEFTTSHALVNQLQHNIVWGLKGNFLDVPTDCPQRDERLGWTGDAQMFAATAMFNADVASFFTKWLKDLAADQQKSGAVPHVIPDVLSRPDRAEAGSAGWADAAVIIPWTMYLAYGDRRVLEEQYESMQRWVGYMRERAGEDLVWAGDFHFGDWLAFATTRSDYPGATTGKDLIATAFFAHSTDLLGRAARVLGRSDDAARYASQFDAIKAAFVREFVTAAGRVGEDTQTAYVLALHFDLLPEPLRAAAAARLVRDVRQRRHLTTGFIGTPYLLHVLTRYGYLAEAYQLLQRQEYPSWLYPVTKGATTIWERWDGIRPDGSFQDVGMNSFNHYAYGAVGEWMYRVMAGIEIDPDVPAYRHILIQPRPGGDFTSVSASHETLHGRVASAWKRNGAGFELSVEIPANTRATVRLPGASVSKVTEGGQPPTGRDGIASVRQDGADAVVEIGSGLYRFAW